LAKIIYYKQAREDGGIRIGIEFEELSYFELFQNSAQERDPALRWWLEVRCEEAAPISSPEEARQWLLKHADFVKGGLKLLAEKLSAGLDRDFYPLEWEIPNPPEGIRATIVCSVARRVAGREIADALVETADHWEDELSKLPATHTIL